MENMENVSVRILFVGQYKDGKKSMIKFAIPSNETKNARGLLIIDQWFDSNVPFKNITSDYIDVELDGVVAYKQTYGANATLVLTELSDENGNNLLA